MRVAGKIWLATMLVVVGVWALSPGSASDEASAELVMARDSFTAGRFDRAYEHYREVTLLAPRTELEARARFEMASIAYLRWRDHHEARAQLRVLVHDIPESRVTIDGRLLLARIHAESMDQPATALKEYRFLRDQQAERLTARQHAEASLGVARLEARLGRLDEARSIYEAVWRMDDLATEPRYRNEAGDALIRLATRRGDLGRVRSLLGERLDDEASAQARLGLMCRLIDAELSSDAFADADSSLRLAQVAFPGEARLEKRREHLNELLRKRPHAVSALELKRLQDGIPWSVGRRSRAARSVATTEP